MSKKSNIVEALAKPAEKATTPIFETVTQIAPVAQAPAAIVDGALRAEKARKGRKPPPDNESKHDKLTRLANARVTRACKVIMQIGNLAAYQPSESEVEKMMQALGESCSNVQNRLNGIRRESITFSLR